MGVGADICGGGMGVGMGMGFEESDRGLGAGTEDGACGVVGGWGFDGRGEKMDLFIALLAGFERFFNYVPMFVMRGN